MRAHGRHASAPRSFPQDTDHETPEEQEHVGFRLGVDIGGTFTDAVAISDDGREVTAKAPSTPGNLAKGVLDAVAGLGVDVRELDGFVHGTTAGLNAFLERRGARVALLTTRGFRDVYAIGRASRPAMYDVRYRPAEPLVPRRDVFEITERMTASGEVLTALDEAQVRALAARLRDTYEAVAVVFLHSYANPAHEERVKAILAEEAPDLAVMCSVDVAPEWREYERTSTTVVSAYVAPIVKEYLGRLESQLRERGFASTLRVMQSNGGVMTAPVATDKPIQTLLSGPVGGTVACVEVARLLDLDRLICVDMGGTSFDVSLVINGRATVEPSLTLEGQPMLTPAVAIHTVGAGGGSVAYVEAGALRVGPRSAGAVPGPVCYRRGGTEPTVTDANVVLGRLPGSARLGGDLDLDVEAAGAAIERLGEQLGLDRLAAANGIIAVADAAMANAIREITVSHGIDPRDFSLLAFGGAGPLHAVALAEELDIPRVVIPANPGVLSAWGMLHSDTRHDLVQNYFTKVADLTPEQLEAAIGELSERGRQLLEQDGVEPEAMELVPAADLRYAGQEYTVTVAWDAGEAPADTIARLTERFDAAHLERYGHNNEGEAVECVNLRVTALGRVKKVEIAGPEPGTLGEPAARTRAHFKGEWHDAPVYRRETLGLDVVVPGPAIVLEDACTTAVPPGWAARVAARGTLVIERQQ
ncbi:MAG: hydantoinase/oxoprolinase family protein [Solirubrobacteraceae bacterium]|nr:hydantoinase/oxoprolinase family protein [Solirubrobacteraceae bacterium]